MLDVGTDNEELLQDEHYLGLQQPRLKGAAYFHMVDEFMKAVRWRWPNVLGKYAYELKYPPCDLKLFEKKYLLVCFQTFLTKLIFSMQLRYMTGDIADDPLLQSNSKISILVSLKHCSTSTATIT